MNRIFAAALIITTLSLPLTAQEPIRQGQPAVIMNAIRSLNLTDDQKAAIQGIIASHREAMQAARAAGDQTAMLQTFRTVIHEIATTVLTADQVQQAKDEVRKALAAGSQSH